MASLWPIVSLVVLFALLYELGDSKPSVHRPQHRGAAHRAAPHKSAHHPAHHRAHAAHKAHHPVAHKAPHKAAHGHKKPAHKSAPHHGHTAARKNRRKPKKAPRKKKPARKPTSPTVPGQSKHFGVFLRALNTSVNPCTDFFQHTCGRYISDHPTGGPDGRASWMNHVKDVVDERMQTLLLGNDKTTQTAVTKMRTYRDKCLDVAAIELNGPARTQELRADITANTAFPLLDANFDATAFDAAALTEMLYQISTRMGTSLLIHLEPFRMSDGKIHLVLMPAPLLLRDLADYTNGAAANKRQALNDFLTSIVQIVASDAGSATTKTVAEVKASVDGVLDFERRLAALIVAAGLTTGVDPQTVESKSNKIQRSVLDTTVPNIVWADFFNDTEYLPDPVRFELNKPTTEIFLMNTQFFTALNALIGDNARKEALANYLQIRFILANLKYLDRRFVNAANEFARRIDGSAHVSNRRQDCLEDVVESFHLVNDHFYVSNFLPADKKRAVEEMAENVRAGFREAFTQRNTWLSLASRTAVVDKLSAMRVVVGAVDDAADGKKLDQRYANLDLLPADSYRRMGVKVQLHARHRKMLSLIVPEYYSSTAVETSMRATDVNAAHVLSENTIFIPAAITDIMKLQNPAAYNYGMLGTLIAHEFAHGFDSVGARFDKNGQPGGDLFDAATRTAFNERAKCFVDQYNAVQDSDLKFRVNGQQTLAENIADNAAVRAAYFAYQKALKAKGGKDAPVRGYSQLTHEQTFFVSMGVAFCDHQSRANRLSFLQTNAHSPNFARIDGALSNFFAFTNAFHCAAGTPMNHRPKDKQCRIW